MQNTTTWTSIGLNLTCNILIKFEQKTVKPGIGKKSMAHLICLSIFLVENRRQPPRIIFKLFEGVFLCPSDNVIRNQGGTIRYFGHSHNALALRKLRAEGAVKIQRFDDTVLKRLQQVSNEVVAEAGSGNEMSRRIYASYRNFRALIADWTSIAEGSYWNTRSLVG